MRMEIDERPACVGNVGGQRLFCEDWRHFIVALEGGWMSGKTWAGARKLLTLHLHNAAREDGTLTYVPSVVVAPTYANALDFDVPELQAACRDGGIEFKWHGPGAIAGGMYYGPAMILPGFGTKRRPSVILIRTADAPERITGWQVGAAWGDEPPRWKEDRTDPSRDPFTQLLGRVRHPDARFLQILFTYTNEGDTTRIFDEMHAGQDDRVIYRAPTKENPLAVDFVERQMRSLTLDLQRQYLGGEAISIRGGRMYPSFDSQKHVSSGVGLVPGLPLQLAVDFNIVPGMHGEIGQYDEKADTFTVVHEIHAQRMSVKGLVAYFVRMTKPGGELHPWAWPILEVFGDATGNARWAATGDTCYDVLHRGLQDAGIRFRFRVPGANPPVVDRVNAMEIALADIDGVVHWQCHKRCVRLIEDLRKLKYNERGEIDKSDKNRSHPSDAEGYRVWYIRPLRRAAAASEGRYIY